MEEQFAIRQAKFVTSAGTEGNYPEALPCEIAIVGKSNVGKSSLINRLTNNPLRSPARRGWSIFIF